MFHSVPAMLIAGLVVYLAYESSSVRTRFFLSFGVMIGFLSHLVLDEMCSVNFEGMTLKLNKSAGSAVKFWSPSWIASTLTYILLLILIYFALQDYEQHTGRTILPNHLKISF